MTALPTEFIDSLRPYIAADELAALADAFDSGTPPVSIRLNPRKRPAVAEVSDPDGALRGLDEARRVPWCVDGYYLAERPMFTLDPLLHAGAYYVQEASSMFITHVLRHPPLFSPLGGGSKRGMVVLDLCAAPGGKTTAAIAALPEGSTVVANEVDRRRASVLAENVAKWGWPEVTVTSLSADRIGLGGDTFDVILVDAPCSGEGMFRKDPASRGEWSLRKVDECVAVQRAILADVWPALRPGGLLVYSTCTLNVREDEEALAYIVNGLGGEALAIPTDATWGVAGPLVGTLPCCRFMPHRTLGEGLFVAAVRKAAHQATSLSEDATRRVPTFVIRNSQFVIQDAVRALSTDPSAHAEWHDVDVPLPVALDYLRRQAIRLPDDAPRGVVRICYRGLGLGLAKNIGTRANNLYPMEWRIRNL